MKVRRQFHCDHKSLTLTNVHGSEDVSQHYHSLNTVTCTYAVKGFLHCLTVTDTISISVDGLAHMVSFVLKKRFGEHDVGTKTHWLPTFTLQCRKIKQL